MLIIPQPNQYQNSDSCSIHIYGKQVSGAHEVYATFKANSSLIVLACLTFFLLLHFTAEYNNKRFELNVRIYGKTCW